LMQSKTCIHPRNMSEDMLLRKFALPFNR